jgi:hypothetical protein
LSWVDDISNPKAYLCNYIELCNLNMVILWARYHTHFTLEDSRSREKIQVPWNRVGVYAGPLPCLCFLRVCDLTPPLCPIPILQKQQKSTVAWELVNAEFVRANFKYSKSSLLVFTFWGTGTGKERSLSICSIHFSMTSGFECQLFYSHCSHDS